MPPGFKLIEEASQLMFEYDYYVSGDVNQQVKKIGKAIEQTTQSLIETTQGLTVAEVENDIDVGPVRSRLYTLHGRTHFQNLRTPHVAISLDYFEVVFSLCSCLTQLYSKFAVVEHDGNTHEAIFRIDDLIMMHFQSAVYRDLTNLAANILHSQLGGALALLCSDKTPPL